MVLRERKIFLLQRAGSIDDFIHFTAANQHKNSLGAHRLLNDIGKLLQNVTHQQKAGNLLAECSHQFALLLSAAHKECAEKRRNQQIQQPNHHHQRHGHEDHSVCMLQAGLLRQEGLQRQHKPIRQHHAGNQRHNEAVGPGDQHGHLEQPLLIQRVKQQAGIDHTGQDIQRESQKDRQRGQCVTGNQRHNAQDNRQELMKYHRIPLAVPVNQEDHLPHAQNGHGEDDVNLPPVFVNELQMSILCHDLGRRDQQIGKLVEHQHSHKHQQPDYTAVASLLLQKIQCKMIKHHRQQHDAAHRNIVPKVHRWPELCAHGERTAAPKDQHHQQCHEGIDDLLFFFHRQERHKQEQIAKERNNRNPAIPTHKSVPSFLCPRGYGIPEDR